MNLDVSVIIPTYNGVRYLRECLDSVRGQFVLPAEVIVVDEASTDGTPEFVAGYARATGLQIRLIVLQQNTGSPSRPMNVGIEAASCELIAVLDQDDVLLPTKIRDEASALADHEELVFAGSASARVDDPQARWQSAEVCDEIRTTGRAYEGFWKIDGREMLRLLLEHGCFLMGFPGFTFRRQAWKAIGGIDESLRIADHGFLCGLATQGPAAFIERVNYLRRIHDSNVSGDRLAVGRDFLRVARKYLRGRGGVAVDPSRVMSVRGCFVGMAYAFRDSGHYLDAWRCYRDAAAVWGWNRELVTAAAKLLPHWLAITLLPRSATRSKRP